MGMGNIQTEIHVCGPQNEPIVVTRFSFILNIAPDFWFAVYDKVWVVQGIFYRI